MWKLSKIQPKRFKWTRRKNKNTHKHRLIFSKRPPKRNNHSGNNGKPHQLQKYRTNIGIQRPSKNGWTCMDQLNVQRTWPNIPGLGKTCSNWHNRVHLTQTKTKRYKGELCEISMQHQTSENRDLQKKTHFRSESYRLSRRSILNIPPKINNHSGNNGKPHHLQNYRTNIGIQRSSKNGWTGMDQLNVQRTWPTVPGLGKHAVTDTIEFI